MKFEKYSPPPVKKKELLDNITDTGYASELCSIGEGTRPKGILRGILTAAAMLVIAVVSITAAIAGREMRYAEVFPAGENDTYFPDGENYIFINGYFNGTAKDGEFTDVKATVSQLLSNSCFYGQDGTKYTEVYINMDNYSEKTELRKRLEKYSVGEYRNYYKFTLPTVFDEADTDIALYGGVILNDGELPEGVVCSYPISIESPEYYETELSDHEKNTIITFFEGKITDLGETHAYLADFDGDGKKEKLVESRSRGTSSAIPYSIICIMDDRELKKVYSSHGFLEKQYSVSGIFDLDNNGTPEYMLSSADDYSVHYYLAKVFTGGIFADNHETTMTLRELAARIYCIGKSIEYEVDFPEKEMYSWYYDIYGENVNMGKIVTYGDVYAAALHFADKNGLTINGWEPFELYDSTTTALRANILERIEYLETAIRIKDYDISVRDCVILFTDILIKDDNPEVSLSYDWYDGNGGRELDRETLTKIENRFFEYFSLKKKPSEHIFISEISTDAVTEYIHGFTGSFELDLGECYYATVNGVTFEGDELTQLLNHLEAAEVSQLSVAPITTGNIPNTMTLHHTSGATTVMDYSTSAVTINGVTYSLPDGYLLPYID